MTSRAWLRRRAFVVAAIVVVVAAALVAVGRAERGRAIRYQLDGIDRVRAAANATNRPPDAYRLAPNRDCLLWRTGPNRFALELCYALDGRLIEAIDRRPAEAITYSIAWAPGEARLRVPPAQLSATLRRMDAFGVIHVPRGVLPSGLQDLGPRTAGVPYRPLGT